MARYKVLILNQLGKAQGLSMKTKQLIPLASALLLSTLSATLTANAVVNTLVGWAKLPANTVSVGPTTGQFGGTAFGANSHLLPIINGQSVQGFSAVLNGPSQGTYYVMPDNGFGTQANSADALLRVYAVKPDFKTWNGNRVVGTGAVNPLNINTGAAQTVFNNNSFNNNSFINLRDTDHQLGFTIQADFTHYYNKASDPVVDASIRDNRLLSGADLDIESMQKDKNGHLWFGDEFGPFLLKTDATGKVLRSEIATPNILPPNSTATGAYVQAPQNPYLAGHLANLGGSHGFEGIAINTAGDKLYTLLEGTVTGDAPKSLRINTFDINTETFTKQSALYQLDPLGTNIGDMTAINDHEFLVLERNGATATSGTPFKKVFKIDIAKLDANGFADKSEVVDLMNIADPHDLNGDGSQLFTFPYVTIEDILIVDKNTILVMNDNNFPGGGGRSTAPDSTEFLLISLSQPIANYHNKLIER